MILFLFSKYNGQITDSPVSTQISTSGISFAYVPTDKFVIPVLQLFSIYSLENYSPMTFCPLLTLLILGIKVIKILVGKDIHFFRTERKCPL